MHTSVLIPGQNRSAAQPVDQRAFRDACGNFVTGVTVVTARSSDGVHGSTVNSFTSLSADPAQIIVCLSLSTQTLGHVRASGSFAVNVLSSRQEEIARLFASKADDKLARVAWSPGVSGAPLIEGSMSSMECEVVSMHEQATHMLIIGRVVAIRHDPETTPLVFFRSRLSSGEDLVGTAA